MGLTDEVDDWQVLGLWSVGVGFGLAIVSFKFDFYSSKAEVTARFGITGYGSGIGGKSFSWQIPGASAWSSIDCKRPFSVLQLDQSTGTIANFSLATVPGVSIGPCFISAIKSSGALFSDQDVGGVSGGLSAGAFTLAGRWKWLKLVTAEVFGDAQA